MIENINILGGLFMTMENLSNILKVLLRLTFVMGVFVTLFLSVILKRYFDGYLWDNNQVYWGYLILLTPCGICSLNILWQLSCMMQTIHNKNPFIQKNVVCLKRIAFSSFGISLLFLLLMLLVEVTALTFAISYIFVIAGFSFLVFGWLIQKAMEYKDENDLTV